MKQYDIWMAALPEIDKSCVQSGCRPVLIVSNDTANKHSPVVTVVPLTRRMKKRYLPTHILITGHGLSGPSQIMCETILTIDKTRLKHLLGRIEDKQERETVQNALVVQLNIKLPHKKRVDSKERQSEPKSIRRNPERQHSKLIDILMLWKNRIKNWAING